MIVFIRLGIIKRESLVTEIKSKKSSYTINDNFFHFCFIFAEPYKSDLEMGEIKNIEDKFKRDFPSYVGKKFEKLIRDDILKRTGIMQIDKIGRQWGKIPNMPKDKNQYEIDIVALNEKNKEILFGECKWQEHVNAETIIKELSEKAGYVDWNLEKRKEIYTIFAKSFKKKIEEYNGKRVYCFDLRDMERNLKK